MDEPSIGLHSKDAKELLAVLIKLRDIGNTVVVVEHDSLFMEAADTLIDIGPAAGSAGGQVVFSGNGAEIKQKNTLTAKYLKGEKRVHREIRSIEKKANTIGIRNASLNNLKNINDRKNKMNVKTSSLLGNKMSISLWNLLENEDKLPSEWIWNNYNKNL